MLSTYYSFNIYVCHYVFVFNSCILYHIVYSFIFFFRFPCANEGLSIKLVTLSSDSTDSPYMPGFNTGCLE